MKKETDQLRGLMESMQVIRPESDDAVFQAAREIYRQANGDPVAAIKVFSQFIKDVRAQLEDWER